jgi:uncharacterized membrane protein
MDAQTSNRPVRGAFAVTLFFSALTGFAQMPIFKRYYIADIPGLGWLADFYATYYLHHVSAMLVIAIGTYLVAEHLLLQRKSRRIAAAGYLRGALLLLIIISGALLVFRNLPGYRFAPQWAAGLIYAHLGLVMLFLATSLVARLMGKGWTAA